MSNNGSVSDLFKKNSVLGAEELTNIFKGPVLLGVTSLMLTTYKPTILFLDKNKNPGDAIVYFKQQESDKQPYNLFKLEKNSMFNYSFKNEYRIILAINKEKTLRFKVKNFAELKKWMNAFQSVGVELHNTIVPNKPNVFDSVLDTKQITNTMQSEPDTMSGIRLDTHNYVYWGTKHVQEWLDLAFFLEEKTLLKHLKEIFLKNHIDGKRLSELQDSQFEELGITDEIVILKLLKALNDLKEKKIFDYGLHNVALKLKGQTKGVKKMPTVDQILKLARNLSSESHLKESYLNPNDESVIVLLNILKELNRNSGGDHVTHSTILASSSSSVPSYTPTPVKDVVGSNIAGLYDEALQMVSNKPTTTATATTAVPTTTASNNNGNNRSNNNTDEISGEEDEIDEDEEENLFSPTGAMVTADSKLKVKLVITNINANDKFRSVISPLVNFFNPKSFEYGLFHTALIIGPFYLEWNGIFLLHSLTYIFHLSS